MWNSRKVGGSAGMVSVGLVALFALGCSASVDPVPGGSDESLGTTEDALQNTGCYPENWYGGYYNNIQTLAPWNKSLAQAKRAQTYATRAFRKVMAQKATGCAAADAVITNWTKSNPWPTLSDAWVQISYTAPNGIKVAAYVDKAMTPDDAKYNMWKSWATALNSCSTDNPAAFAVQEAFCTYNPYNGQTGFKWMEMDPEPAVLSASLGGTKGATAAAKFGDGTTTTAITWPSSYTTSSTDISDRSCSTTALANGANVPGIIQKSGSYYRCVGG